MTRMRTICHFAAILISMIMIYKPALADPIRVIHAKGGQATALEVGDGYWYQALGDRLVVLDISSADVVSTVMLASHRAGGACVDLLLDQHTLYALIDGKGVVVLDCSNQRMPVLKERIPNRELGIEPKGFSFVGSRPTAFGISGATRLSDRHRWVTCEGEVTSVALSIDKGVVFVKQGQLTDAKTGEQLRQATSIIPLEDSANAVVGTIVSAYQIKDQLILQLISADVTEKSESYPPLILQCERYKMITKGSRLLVATEDQIHIIGIAPKELRLLQSLPIQGVKDLGIVGSNYLAVCGEFGRGLYRIAEDQGGRGNSLFRVVPAAGSFSAGKVNRDGIQIPSSSGSAQYRFGESISYSDLEVKHVEIPMSTVIMGWRAAIDPDTSEVFIIDSEDELIPLPIPPATSIASISGNFWIGTTEGVYIYGNDGTGRLVELASISIAGPVIQLIPMGDSKAAFVTSAGFAGIVEAGQDAFALEQ